MLTDQKDLQKAIGVSMLKQQKDQELFVFQRDVLKISMSSCFINIKLSEGACISVSETYLHPCT